MTVTAIIPARLHSNRLPGKVLLPIAGKPMLQRVVEQIRTSMDIDAIWIATDSKSIANLAMRINCNYFLPHVDSEPHVNGTSRIADLVDPKKTSYLHVQSDIIVNVQADQPFVTSRMLRELILPLQQDPALQMTTLKHRITNVDDLIDPAVVKVVTNKNDDALYFSRSIIPNANTFDVKAHAFFEHVGIYAYRRQFLLDYVTWPQSPCEQVESLEQLRVLDQGHSIRVVEIKSPDHAFTCFSIDTPEDLERAEWMLQERGLE